MRLAPIGIAFTPAGLLFPYYVGVGYELQRLGVLTPGTPLGGSSAGAIVAACLACQVPEETVLKGLATLVEDVRNGARLNVALRKQLELFLDEESLAAAQAQPLTIGYLEVLPRPGRRLVSSWHDKDDLIDCIGASCNWPLFFSRWPFVVCRGSWCLDGFFSVPRARFGCPPLNAERMLVVTALPRVSVPAFRADEPIQPGERYEPALPVDSSEWFSWALKPAADDEIRGMVSLGRQNASHSAAKDVDSNGPASGKHKALGSGLHSDVTFEAITGLNTDTVEDETAPNKLSDLW